jgi:hypothetical protein
LDISQPDTIVVEGQDAQEQLWMDRERERERGRIKK